jgi:hypothetical protein
VKKVGSKMKGYVSTSCIFFGLRLVAQNDTSTTSLYQSSVYRQGCKGGLLMGSSVAWEKIDPSSDLYKDLKE